MASKRNLILFGIAIVVIVLGIIYIPQIFSNANNQTNNQNNHSSYSWANDPHRLNQTVAVYNLTLIVDYQNGTLDQWNNVNLTDHYTSCFDLLANKTQVQYSMYYFGNSAEFKITSINGVTENSNNQKYWQYYVNSIYATTGCNYFQLLNNSIVKWVYGMSSQSTS
jgi:hypothetical protein